jgi:hypothetical protein
MQFPTFYFLLSHLLLYGYCFIAKGPLETSQ